MQLSHTPPDTKIVPIAKRPVAPSKEQLPSPTFTGVSKKVSYRNPSLASTCLGDDAAKLKYKPGKWDIWMLGITIVIGGQYFSWNAGLTAGLYSYLICYFVIASAYVTLCCCTSEITGGLPFAGGAYGLARCTLGFLPAFLIGCCETLEYIVYVSTSVISLADMIVEVCPSLRSVKPLIWALFYISALYVHIKGDRVFWIFNLVIGSTSILIVVIFVFGSLPFVDYAAYAHQPSLNLVDGFAGLLKVLPLACWFFVGVEALNLAGESDHVGGARDEVQWSSRGWSRPEAEARLEEQLGQDDQQQQSLHQRREHAHGREFVDCGCLQGHHVLRSTHWAQHQQLETTISLHIHICCSSPCLPCAWFPLEPKLPRTECSE